ncbi:MAG: pantetheine-phosphate adenylyltransferase [Anaerolineae bacterium]
MVRTAVFPATFDPITNGHVDIAERAARIFDHLVIGVYAHGDGDIKATVFSAAERVRLVEAAVAHLDNVSVRPYEGLTVDFARAESAQAIVRGLRVADDFEFERQMAMMNRHLAPEVDSLLLISDPAHAFVSASLVRQVSGMGGDVRGLVPAAVAESLARKHGASTDMAG